MRPDMYGTTVLVTGGTGGIGMATATGLAGLGARDGVVIKRFTTKLSPRGLVTQNWRGLNGAGGQVRGGDHVVVMKAADLAGNLRSVRVRLPVSR